jgi:hypothetical protein
MPININSAYRTLNILNTLRANGNGSPAYKILGSAFKVFGEDIYVRKEVIKRLPLLIDQFENILNQMSNTSFSENLYRNYFKNVISAFTTINLDTDWGHFVHNINSELMLALKWCSEVLPDEEEHLDDATVKNWIDKVEKLLFDLTSSDLSIDLRQLLSKHLESLRDALNKYQLVGLREIEDSLLQTLGSLNRQKTRIHEQLQEASDEDREQIYEYENILKEVGNAVDSADKTHSKDIPPLLSNFSLYGTNVLPVN